jgi:hypothetical protein
MKADTLRGTWDWRLAVISTGCCSALCSSEQQQCGGMQHLGLTEPVKKLRVLHVAGTKGKGSACTLAEGILRHSGYSTGLLTSPHLCDVRERIRIDGCAGLA